MMKSISARSYCAEQPRSDFRHGHPAEVGMAPSTPRPGSGPRRYGSGDPIGNVLAGAKLLIVEDEFLVAQDLIYGPQREGIDVLGPYNSIDSAIDVLRTADNIGAAILDLNIRGHLAFDLAETLIAKNIPFIFYTGYDSVIVPEKFRNIGRVRKPADWQEIKRALFGGDTERSSSTRFVKRLSSSAPDLTSMLPALRQRAREITASNDMAERLVEKTLERAIREIHACPAGVPMEHWLIGLLETTGIGDHKHLH